MRGHLAEGTLQAIADRELRVTGALPARIHLGTCAQCRARLAEVRRRGAIVSALMCRAAPAVDAAAGWGRFVVRSGGRVGAGRASRTSARWYAAFGALAFTALALYSGVGIPASSRPVTSSGTLAGRAEVDAGTLLTLVRDAQAHPAAQQILRDACCDDHDGGDRADDGLLTLSRPGENVAAVVVYEDVDGSGTFTPGDVVRYVSSGQRR